jgi:prepilin-type N-terminal cleavage/methylation domain-containing protein
VSRRVGFTLIEIMIVVVIFGIMVLVAYPKVGSALVKNDVRSARTTLANMFSKARAVAMQGSRTGRVEFNGNNVLVTASPRLTVGGTGTRDTVGGVQNLNSLYHVTLSFSPSPVASIVYDPRGFVTSGLSQPLKLYLTRSGTRDSLTLDYLGRVTK